jgi:hypothetical protein
LLAADFDKSDSIASAVQGAWRLRDSLKHYLERQWYQNIAWYNGHQYLFWDQFANNLRELPAPSYRARMTTNHLMPFARTIAAKLHGNPPVWDVLPATNDSVDILTAEISNQVLSSNWYTMQMRRKYMQALWWVCTTGNAFIKQVWNPDGGPPVFQSANPDDEIGFEYDEDLAIGEIEAHVVSGFDLLIDPNCSDFMDARWAMESRLVHVEELKEKWDGVNIDKIRKGSTSSQTNYSFFGEQLKKMLPAGQGRRTNPLSFGGNRGDEQGDMVVVHELWVKPFARGRLKHGFFGVIAGEEVLHAGKHPYMHRKLPYVHLKEIPVPGRVWGASSLEHLIPLQQSLNRTKSQLIENRNLLGNPKLLVPRGSGISNTALTSEPGEKVHYNPGFAPETMQASPMPSYIERMLDDDRRDMEDIAGIHEVSQGQATGQLRGSQGIMALLESDETRFRPVMEAFQLSIEEVGRQNLALAAQFITEERLAKAVGSNDELAMFTYTGSDLLGTANTLPGVDYLDVRVRTVSGMPNNRIAQQEMIKGLVQDGIFNPREDPKDKRLVLKLLNIGSAKDHMDDSRVHRARQWEEIRQMSEGITPRVETWHDHEVHIEELKKFMNSARFDRMEIEDKALFMNHLEQHEQTQAMELVKPEIMVRAAAAVAARQNPLANEGMPNEEGRQRPQQQRPQLGNQRQQAQVQAG